MAAVEEARKRPIWARPPVLRLLCVALFAELGVAVLNVLAMPVYLRDERNLTEGIAGVVMMAFLLTEALFKSYFGHLADRFGRSRFLLFAPIVWMTTPLLTLAVPPSWGSGQIAAFVGLRVLDGVAAAMLWPAAYAAVAEAVEDGQKSKALSMLNVCFMVGLALGVPAGGVVNSLFDSLSAAFYLATILFAATFVAAACCVRTDLRAKHSEADAVSEHSIADVVAAAKKLPLVLIVGFITFFGVGVPMVVIQFFAKDVFGLSQAQFGALVLPAAIAMAVLSVPLGSWGEKIGRGRAVKVGLLFCACGVWFISLGNWFAPFESLWAVAVGAILVGLGFLLAIPAWYASVSLIDSRRSASNLGAVMTAQGFGAIVGLLVGAKAYEVNPYAPFILCSGAVSIGWVLSLLEPTEAKSSRE